MKHQALVNRLHSVETLGCAGILCADKTGTITENDMTVTDLVISTAHFSVDQCIRQQGAASLSRTASGFANFTGMLYALHHGRTYPLGTKSHRRPDRNRPANRSGKGWLLSGTLQATLSPPPYGAFRPAKPKRWKSRFLTMAQNGNTSRVQQTCVLPLCTQLLHGTTVTTLTESFREEVRSAVQTLSERALRVLAFAYRESDGD